ncbi:hypothetical protein PO124_33185 [Bacillus licheniformis]|nr:hypothetical protein [Bacillus licheniformis]
MATKSWTKKPGDIDVRANFGCNIVGIKGTGISSSHRALMT